jgi:hypothetical protein
MHNERELDKKIITLLGYTDFVIDEDELWTGDREFTLVTRLTATNPKGEREEIPYYSFNEKSFEKLITEIVNNDFKINDYYNCIFSVIGYPDAQKNNPGLFYGIMIYEKFFKPTLENRVKALIMHLENEQRTDK